MLCDALLRRRLEGVAEPAKAGPLYGISREETSGAQPRGWRRSTVTPGRLPHEIVLAPSAGRCYSARPSGHIREALRPPFTHPEAPWQLTPNP